MKNTQTKIGEITALSLEKDDNLGACLDLASVNIPCFGEMVNTYLIHEIVEWIRFKANECDNDLDPFVLALGHRVPNLFINRFRFITTCLIDGEEDTLELIGVSKNDCEKMLEWLKTNYSLIVEDARLIKMEGDAQINSPAVKEHFDRLFKNLFGRDQGDSPVS